MSYGDLWPLVRISLTSFVVGFVGASLGTWAIGRWGRGADACADAAAVETAALEIEAILGDIERRTAERRRLSSPTVGDTLH